PAGIEIAFGDCILKVRKALAQLLLGHPAFLKGLDDLSKLFCQVCFLEFFRFLQQFQSVLESRLVVIIESKSGSAFAAKPVIVPGQRGKVKKTEQQDEADREIGHSRKLP